MDKLLWKDAPEWANWLAQDRDGSWFWYTTKPRQILQHGIWINSTGTKHGKQDATVIATWTSTLEKRPRK